MGGTGDHHMVPDAPEPRQTAGILSNDGARADYRALVSYLGDLESVLVAFSGGVDSTVVAAAALEALADRAQAVLSVSVLSPSGEADEARAIAASLGLPLIELESDPLADDAFTRNTPERCYACKASLFSRFTQVAHARGLAHVVDGENADDSGGHRPGSRAARELGVISPLRELGLTKSRIREVAREIGLPNWDKPSMACLASRFPYGHAIDGAGLHRVRQAERALTELGLTRLRVRAHGDLARIEIEPRSLAHAWESRDAISQAVKAAGFTWVSLDLEGYRTGAMDEVLGSSDA